MRTLSATLTSNQAGLFVTGLPYKKIYKIVLTRSGQATKTYTKTRIKKIIQTEKENHGVSIVLLDNSDDTLTSLDFEMYKCVISLGYNDPTQGDEYSPLAPLYVINQRFFSAQGVKVCQLEMVGIPNQMAMDKAESVYTQNENDTNTVKTLITAVVDKTLAPYTNYNSYSATFDGTDDALLGTFIPRDYFRVGENENRLDKVQELLLWTGEKMRPEDDGALHFFDPVISGDVYDYEYKLKVSGEHTFFDKELTNRFVNPNKVIVKSLDVHNPQYSGSATSATSFALAPKTETLRLLLASNAQAADLAVARIETYELDAETGAVRVPMNVGQEVWDYIKVTDSRQGDSRTGNVRYIRRHVEVTGGRLIWDMQIRFGKSAVLPSPIFLPTQILRRQTLVLPESTQLLEAYRDLHDDLVTTIEKLDEVIGYLNEQREDAYFRRLTVTDDLTIPVEGA